MNVECVDLEGLPRITHTDCLLTVYQCTLHTRPNLLPDLTRSIFQLILRIFDFLEPCLVWQWTRRRGAGGPALAPRPA